MNLRDQSLGEFLDGIASEAPAPGAGSGAAVALAIGLACARKAIRLTLKHHSNEPDLVALDRRLAGLVGRAVAGGEADMRGFAAYIAALQRPKNDPDRGPAEEEALAGLTAVAGDLVAVGEEARAGLQAVRTEIYPAMANDVAAALALIAAARAIHAACGAESARALSP